MPWLTVKKNIMMGPKLHHKSRKECEEIAQKYIDMVGLSGIEDYYPRQLSGGMAARVGIARALANEPKIITYGECAWRAGCDDAENMRRELLNIFQKTENNEYFSSRIPYRKQCIWRTG